MANMTVAISGDKMEEPIARPRMSIRMMFLLCISLCSSALVLYYIGFAPLLASISPSPAQPACLRDANASAPPIPLIFTSSNSGHQDSMQAIRLTVITILTQGRSSSTYLAKGVLGDMPCHKYMSELFSPHKEKDKGEVGIAWRKEGKIYPKAREDQAAHFMVAVARRQCQEMFEANATLAKECNHHCYPNVKLFHGHVKAPYFGILLRDLKQFNEKVIILERKNVEDVWKSMMYSNETHFYNQGILPGDPKREEALEEHKKDLAKKRESLKPMPDSFKNDHDEWFGFVRYTVKEIKLPRLELTFENATAQPIEELREGILHFIESDNP